MVNTAENCMLATWRTVHSEHELQVYHCCLGQFSADSGKAIASAVGITGADALYPVTPSVNTLSATCFLCLAHVFNVFTDVALRSRAYLTANNL
jgi:hypothetical protein